MYTDYSGKCLGAVLTQKFPEGERPIQFISHKLSSSQQKWPPVVGECYSIFWALQKFRPYLYWCKKVTCFTDHKPLVYWQTANYDSNRLIQRWLLSFQEYNIEVKFLSGLKNKVADFYSRINWPENFNPDSEDENSVHTTNEMHTTNGKHDANTPNVCSNIAFSTTNTKLDPALKCLSKEVGVINADRISVPGESLLKQYRSLIQDNPVQPMSTQNTQQQDAEGSCVTSSDTSSTQHNSGNTTFYDSLHATSTAKHVTSDINMSSHTITTTPSGEPLDDLKGAQSDDPFIYQIIKQLNSPDCPTTIKNKYIMLGDILYYIPKGEEKALKLMVPVKYQKTILRELHENNSHIGCDRCYDLISKRYHWYNLYRDVVQHCLVDCPTCKQFNLKQDILPLQETLRPKFPFQIISIDLCGEYMLSYNNNKYIFTIQDIMTGWPEAYCLNSKSPTEIAKIFLENFWVRYGTPLICTSDRGSEWCNKIMNEVFSKLKVARIITSPYSPSGNLIERFHRFLKASLTKCLHNKDPRLWDTYVPQILSAYRFSTHDTNGYSPFYALHGFDVVLPLDSILQPRRKYMGDVYSNIFLENLHRAYVTIDRRARRSRAKMRQKHQQKVTRTKPYAVGDAVYYYKVRGKDHKWGMQWDP